MGYDGQGTIYVPLSEFYLFLRKFHPIMNEAEVRYGNMRITSEDLEIDYAFSTDTPPEQWANPPKFLNGLVRKREGQ